MHKKAQGLSLTTIVIAAVVLIILIVLVGIFTGYFSKFVPSLMAAGEQSCEGIGFDKTQSECDPETQKRVYGNFGDSLENGKVCCKFTNCIELGGVCVDGVSCGSNSKEIKDGTADCRSDPSFVPVDRLFCCSS